MIVIATHNGANCLPMLLQRLEDFRINDEIVIVDTQSDDQASLDYLKTIKYPILVTPERTFDTGAYIWAYQNTNAEIYHFFHDSQNIKNPDFFEMVEGKLKDFDAVVYGWFDESYDEAIAHPSQRSWKEFFESNVGEQRYVFGVFGPMFSCTRLALDKLNLNSVILPRTKIEQCGWERIWSMLFTKYGLSVDRLARFEGHDRIHLHPFIEKTFLDRQ